MQENTKISIYKGAKDKVGSFVTIQTALDAIRSGDGAGKNGGTLAEMINDIRREPDKTKRTALKIKLPAVTWSGYFIKRSKENLHAHSGLLCIDIDNLLPQDLSEYFKELCADQYVHAVFVSPSGNGLKVLFKIDMSGFTAQEAPAAHELYFLAIENYLQVTYHIVADASGKDVSRLCFLSYDPKMFLSSGDRQAVVITDEIQNQMLELNAGPKALPAPAQEAQAAPDLGRIHTFTSKVKSYEPGQRNDFINQFVVNCKHQAVDRHDCEAYALNKYEDYKDGERGIKAIIQSVYGNSAIEFGKFAKGKKLAAAKQKSATVDSKTAPGENPLYNESILFWYEQETVNQKTGQAQVEVKFDHDKITYFLSNNGFKKIQVGHGFQYIRIKDNQIEPVEGAHISTFVHQYLSQNLTTDEAGNYVDVEDDLYPVRKMFKRGQKSYCSDNTFGALPLFTPNFVRDTEKTSYVYFKNCFVEVTKDGWTARPYAELKGHIWKRQIIDKEFTLMQPEEYNKCVFQKFLSLAVVGNPEQIDETARKKIMAVVTAIGYLVHRYKDSTNAKAVVAVDKKLRHSNESNGGSGKSLLFKAISKVVYTDIENGKSFKFDAPYPFSKLHVDHGLVVFNDVLKNFDFERLFHYITEDWDVEKKYVDTIIMPFEESPKVGVATNFTLQGNGDSFLRRQHIIEFSNYFNAGHDPIKEFGHRFFSDWDAMEWNRFYNFMLNCTKHFLKLGLVESPLENYGINKLIDSMGEEGAEWLDDNINDTPEAAFSFDTRHAKNVIFERFKNDLPQYTKLKPNTFTGWVKQWARIRGVIINAHKNGEQDKSGPTYYLTFTKPAQQ